MRSIVPSRPHHRPAFPPRRGRLAVALLAVATLPLAPALAAPLEGPADATRFAATVAITIAASGAYAWRAEVLTEEGAWRCAIGRAELWNVAGGERAHTGLDFGAGIVEVRCPSPPLPSGYRAWRCGSERIVTNAAIGTGSVRGALACYGAAIDCPLSVPGGLCDRSSSGSTWNGNGVSLCYVLVNGLVTGAVRHACWMEVRAVR